MKQLILSLILVLITFSSLYAKEGFQIGFGLLFPFYIDANGIEDSELPVVFPKGSIQVGFEGWALEVEGISKSLMVRATGGLSGCLSGGSCDVVESDLKLTGQVVSTLIKLDVSLISDDSVLYLGYGVNQFHIDQQLTDRTQEAASNSGVDFDQSIDPEEGRQFLFGIEQEIMESITLDFDYWLMTIPTEVSSSFLDINSEINTERTENVDLNFTILAFGISYYF